LFIYLFIYYLFIYLLFTYLFIIYLLIIYLFIYLFIIYYLLLFIIYYLFCLFYCFFILLIIKIYFKENIYSPKPKTIDKLIFLMILINFKEFKMGILVIYLLYIVN